MPETGNFLDEFLKNCSLWEVPTAAWWLLLFAVTRHNASKGLPPSTSFKRPFFLAFEHATLDHRRHLKTMSWNSCWKYIVLYFLCTFRYFLNFYTIEIFHGKARIWKIEIKIRIKKEKNLRVAINIALHYCARSEDKVFSGSKRQWK